MSNAPETQLLEMRANDKASVNNLTKREIAVLARLAPESTLNHVAAELFVSRNTVKSQLASAYKKLGTNQRAKAIEWVTKAVAGDQK